MSQAVGNGGNTMAFELEARDGAYAFPCAICKNNKQEASVCRATCGIYEISNMEIFDLENSVQKLIYGCRQHPTTASTGPPDKPSAS